MSHTPELGAEFRGVFAFEDIDDSLPFVPLAARRALDVAGKKLSLAGWNSLNVGDKKTLVMAGAASRVDADIVDAVLARATPAPSAIEARPDPPAHDAPRTLTDALGNARAIDAASWRRLGPLERYALAKLVDRPEKLAAAFDAIARPRVDLPHLTSEGAARMVDVAPKPQTARAASASARVRMSADALDRVLAGAAAKGDVLAVARVAGIQAAKRTPELIPLCHSIALTRVEIEFTVARAAGEVLVRATAEAFDRTGVEMEAMVAASVAALTIYDMIKGVDRWMTVESVQLDEKRGGRSGDVRRR